MRIDIIGYVTEPLISYSFTIKITSDSVEHLSLSLSDIQVREEVRISIPPELYPSDDEREFKRLTASDDPRRDKINKCLSFGNALGMGDQIECSVFIVEPETRNGVSTYAINRNRRDIETYADFDHLWLYPNNRYFRRSESDSRESLKFRKQWCYACINREKCGKITGYAYKYRSRRWINKNPKMIFPILWWIQVKTTVSNLWRRFTGQENPSKTSINTVVTVIAIVVGIIGIVVGIWSLFFK